MQMYTHALRTAIYDFGRDFDTDPQQRLRHRESSYLQALLHLDRQARFRRMLEIFGGDGYFEDSPYGPTERLYRDAALCGSKRALPASSASPSLVRPRTYGGVIKYNF